MAKLGRFGYAMLPIAAVALAGLEAEAVERMSIEADTGRAYIPGDLIELRVVALSEHYRPLHLIPPSNPAIRLLEIQSWPIVLDDRGDFRQSWIAVYQAGGSGSFSLHGGYAASDSDGGSIQYPVDPVEFLVEGLESDPAGDQPELWPAQSNRGPSAKLSAMIAMLGAVIVLGYSIHAILVKKSLGRGADEGVSIESEAMRLSAALLDGDYERRDLERFLAGYRGQCPPALVELLERCLYARQHPVIELGQSLRKEFQE